MFSVWGPIVVTVAKTLSNSMNVLKGIPFWLSEHLLVCYSSHFTSLSKQLKNAASLTA